MSFNQALQMIERNRGKVSATEVRIACQQPKPVRYEQAFEGHYPAQTLKLDRNITNISEVLFNGIGIVFKGHVSAEDKDYVAICVMYVDGKPVGTVKLPASYNTRRNDLFWIYQLPKKEHKVTFRWINPTSEASIHFGKALVYSDTPSNNY
jgi:hypothetical protein